MDIVQPIQNSACLLILMLCQKISASNCYLAFQDWAQRMVLQKRLMLSKVEQPRRLSNAYLRGGIVRF